MTANKFIKKKSGVQGTTEYAVRQIEKSIFDNKLLPGDKLPSLSELQEMLGISQGAVREALRILGEKGLVAVKRGRSGGIYVSAVTSSQISSSLALMIRQEQIYPDHLLVVRSTLEVSAAALAVFEADEKGIKQLKRLMVRAEGNIGKGIEGWDAFYRVEDQMHQALAKMTQNPLLESILLTVYKHYQGYNNELVPKELVNMQDAMQDWRDLLDAIENKQPRQAGKIMARHLQRFLPTENYGHLTRQFRDLLMQPEK
jgi:DNA-binding FadR family transcriptional regulator